MTTILFTFATALALALFLTPVMKWAGEKSGAIDKPGARKVHKKPVARTGGVAIFIAFFATLFIGKLYQTRITDLLVFDRELIFLFAGAGVAFTIGLVDDFHRLGSKTKLLFQIVAATIAFYGGIDVAQSNLWVFGPHPGLLSYVMTVFWFVLFINAINLIDGLDGLAGGVVFFGSFVMVVLSVIQNNFTVAMFFAALSGSILGFLRYNFNPARIFLGDGGSYFLGYIVAGLAIVGNIKSQFGAAVLIPVVALGVPLFDTVLSTVRRFLRGKKLFGADADHIHHRLLETGLTTRKTVFIIYGVTILLCVIALFLVHVRDERAGLLLAVMALGAIFFVRKLGYFEYFASEKILGWFKDLGDEAGLSRDRRTFLSRQIDIGQSKSINELWAHTSKALEMIEIDKAMLYLSCPQKPAGSPLGESSNYLNGNDRRCSDPMGASICNRKTPPEFNWVRGNGKKTDSLPSRCLFRLELPLIEDKGTSFGTLVLLKDKALSGMKPHTLRRVEQLRHTILNKLKDIGETSQKEAGFSQKVKQGDVVHDQLSPVFPPTVLANINNGQNRHLDISKGDLLLTQLISGHKQNDRLVEQLELADWKHIIKASVRHHVAPQLYLKLESSMTNGHVPGWVYSRLRKIYIKTAAKNLRLNHELGKVFSALDKEGIPFVELQGVHLGEAVYCNIGARSPFREADLLVKEADFERASIFLEEKGWLSPHSPVGLNLHHRINLAVSDATVDMDKVWGSARWTRVEGVRSRVLSPENLLLLLCCHLAFHPRPQSGGIRTLCDIREILKFYHDRFNWQLFFTTASALGLTNAADLSLELAKDLLGVSIPREVFSRLAADDLGFAMKQLVVEKIYMKSGTEPAFSSRFREIWDTGSVYRRLLLYKRVLEPPRSFVFETYGSRIRPGKAIYLYAVRLKDNLIKHASVGYHVLRRDKIVLELLRRQREYASVRQWLVKKPESGLQI